MSPTAFQIISDLHLETQPSYSYTFKQTAPNLALLGDIGHVAHDGLFTFLETQLTRYWNVFFLLGNHEPLTLTQPAAKRRIHAFAARMESLRTRSTIGRFIFLDQTRHDLTPTLTILGCTLFSHIPPHQIPAVATRLIDFQQTQDWTVADHVEAHASDLRWLNAQLAELAGAEPQRRVVVFTHHSPTTDARAVDARHGDSPVASGFATDLKGEECWTCPAVVMWGFGHTHFSCDFVDEGRGVRVVANQRGYAMALGGGFDAGKVFVVGEEVGEGSSTSSMLLV